MVIPLESQGPIPEIPFSFNTGLKFSIDNCIFPPIDCWEYHFLFSYNNRGLRGLAWKEWYNACTFRAISYLVFWCYYRSWKLSMKQRFQITQNLKNDLIAKVGCHEHFFSTITSSAILDMWGQWFWFSLSQQVARTYSIISRVRKQPTSRDATTAWFPREMTSEKWVQKFHTDDASLPRSR